MEIRLFEKGDTEQIAQLLQDTVKITDTGSTETQVSTQTPEEIDFKEWESSCLKNHTVVAELNRNIISIAQIEKSGHINCFYCHPEFRRRGIGGELFEELEAYARSHNIPAMFTETNTEDHPFFVKMGFENVQIQRVLIHGEVSSFWVIKKDLV